MMRKISKWVTILLFAVWTVLCAYQVAFAFWMTAYPFVDNDEWRIRFYERFALLVVTGIGWIFLALSFLMRRRKAGKAANGIQA